METQVKEQKYINDIETAIDSKTSALATQAERAATKFDNRAQQVGNKVSDFLAQLPGNINRFYQEYKLPIISFALLVATVLALKITFAIIGAVNDIPLVRPFFELVGISYTVWFTYRYLLKDSTRQELIAQLSSTKKQMLG
ncbi:hypothetical protein NIES4071_02550 [Calothrix sp. NIES-4071]|nr:hypothetical protein NIES4071_02550 [Calothrix sp. NIES-4071]BAZ54601.1 hypothetical protein NIES4105_02540 [Calothrix sp. NIES-4105]